MAKLELDVLAAVLREAAKTEILPRFRRLDEGMVRAKSEAIDLVTEADEAAERVITARLKEVAPEAVVVGEEAVAANPSLLDVLAGEADYAITLDPVDGTANFAAGLPLFAVMAAIVRKGETVAGIIYDPMGDDWLMAEQGAGAWLVFPDGRRLRQRIADPVPLARMVGVASPFLLPHEMRRPILSNLDKVRLSASYRCAGHEYRMIAGGHLHFLMYGKLMPWDHLPGTMITREAGGVFGRLDGSPYLVSHTGGGLIVTTDEASFESLRTEVFAT
jgi:fructose-1,6-bisphosphatase/inositol monophosphatase family enzyme